MSPIKLILGYILCVGLVINAWAYWRADDIERTKLVRNLTFSLLLFAAVIIYWQMFEIKALMER